MDKCSHTVSAGIMCRSCYLDLENENKRLREALEDISKLHDEGYSLEDVEKRRGFLGWTCCQNLQEIATQALEDKK